MKVFTARSVSELDAVLRTEGNDALFRGQINHYEVDGQPSVTTSFDREGCIPSEMLKWTYFSKEVLDHWFKDLDSTKDMSQAALQHYGWRSFYVDATSWPSVATWFAGHTFKSEMAIQMCEDHDERPALLRKKNAWYEKEDGVGHLYVFDKTAVNDLVGAIDLSSFQLPDFRPRFTAQAAWLIGQLVRTPMPLECFRAHIIADRGLFREYAARESLVEVNTLFPGIEEDPVLYSFLSLPWLEIKSDKSKGGLRGFRRAIEFPEYQHEFAKRLSGDIALFGGERLTPDEADRDGQIIVVPVVAAVGSADPLGTKFPRVLALLEKKKGVAFEVDYLARHAGQEHTDLYGKGINVRRHDDGTIEVGELMVRHPGFDLTDVGINQGWFYRIQDDGLWRHAPHEGECPCGNDFIHHRHLSALTIIESWLTEPWPLDKV